MAGKYVDPVLTHLSHATVNSFLSVPGYVAATQPHSHVTRTLSASDGESGRCEDRINNIAGSLTCKAFLRSFAYQYCRHKYIKKNCCAAHKIYCNGLRLSRVSVSSSSVRRKRGGQPVRTRPK